MNSSNGSGVERLTIDLSARTKVAVAFETCICTALCILSLLLNSVLISAFYRNAKLREVANIFVFELALCDLLVSTTIFPFRISTTVQGGWKGGVFWCQLQAYWASVVASVSYQTIALAAISRYVRVAHPRSYNSLFRLRYTVYALLTAWLFACAVPVVNIIRGYIYIFHPGKALCVDSFYDSREKQWIFKMGFFIFLPLCVGLFCYIRIYLAVRRNKRRIGVYLHQDSGQLNFAETPQNFRNATLTKLGEGIEANCGTINNITQNLQSLVGNPHCHQETSQVLSQFRLTDQFKLSVEEIKRIRTFSTIAVCFFSFRTPLVVTRVVDIVHEGLALPRQVYLLATYLAGVSLTLNPVILYLMNSVFRTECTKIVKHLRKCLVCLMWAGSNHLPLSL